MKILYYIAIVSMPFFFSCSKGIPSPSLLYAKISIGNRTGALLQLTTDGGPVKEVTTDGIGLELTPGDHRFSFAKNGQPLLDTTLQIPALSKVPAIEYALFQPDPAAALQLWSLDALGMNKVATPPTGYFTISIINADRRLPDVVDVHLFANTWNNGQLEEVEAGVVKAVSRTAFSPFTSIFIGTFNAADFPSNQFVIRVKDPQSGTVLQSFNYENKVIKLAPEIPVCFIYTTYLTGNKLNTLLEK